jgi:hypothetical protein
MVAATGVVPARALLLLLLLLWAARVVLRVVLAALWGPAGMPAATHGGAGCSAHVLAPAWRLLPMLTACTGTWGVEHVRHLEVSTCWHGSLLPGCDEGSRMNLM